MDVTRRSSGRSRSSRRFAREALLHRWVPVQFILFLFAFVFELFFATAVFATGPVLTEAKVGALSTIGAVLITVTVAWTLRAKTSKA